MKTDKRQQKKEKALHIQSYIFHTIFAYDINIKFANKSAVKHSKLKEIT